MKNHILLVLVNLFVSFTVVSQCNFVLINSTTNNFTVNGTSLVPCLNKATFTVNLENVSPFTLSNIELSIDLPDGVNYIASSSSNATEANISDLNNPGFTLVNIGASTTNTNRLSFSIDLDATCELQTFLDAGGIVQNIVTITNDATNNGSIINCNIVHESQPYSASVPNLSVTNISSQSHIGSVGDVFQRCISIINGGSGGLAQFSLNDVHGAGVSINNVDLGTVTTNGLTEEILLTGADFSTIGNLDNIFDPGEKIIVCETVEVLSCVSSASTFRYFWGCNNENCQELTDGANVTFPGEIPNVQTTVYNSYMSNVNNEASFPRTDDPECITADKAYQSGLTFTNTGSGTAYNIITDFDFANGSYSSGADVSSIRKFVNGVQQPFHRDSLVSSSRYGGGWAACLPSNSVGYMKFVIDSIAPGETVYIEWDWFLCFSIKSCGARQHLLHWAYSANYENKCSQPYDIIRVSGSRGLYYNHTFSLDNSPGTLIGGETANVSYVTNNWAYFLPRNTSQDQFRFQIVMPSCLGYDGATFKITETNGTVHTPVSWSRNGDTINMLYDELPTPWSSHTNESTIDFDVSLDCSSCSNGTYAVEMTSFYNPNTAVGCDNERNMGCTTFNLNLTCPDPCPGISFNKHYAKRTNLGLPDNDNDGLPDVGGAIDFSEIRQDRMIFGDTLQILHGGSVNNTLNDSVWPYVVATTQITTGGHLFSYTDGEFTLYQVATGTYHTATLIPAPTENLTGTTRDIRFDLDINALTFNPALPANYSLQDNDSVFLKSNYRIIKNVVDAIVVVNTNSRFYCSDIPNPSTEDKKYGCPNLIKNFTVFGFRYDVLWHESRTTKSCDLVTFNQSFFLNIAGTYGAKNKFVNEYRPFAHPQNLVINIPDSYTYESAQFVFYRTTGVNSRSTTTGNNGTGAISSWYPLNPSTILGDQYTFNTGAYFGDDPINDSILYGDEGFYGTIQFSFSPNCTIEGDTSKRIQYEWEYEPVAQFSGTTNNPTTHTSNSNYYYDDTIVSTLVIGHYDIISYDKPKLIMQSNLVSQNIPSNEAIWNVSITNNSNTSDAHNSWFGIPTVGTVIADSMFDQSTNTMVYPSSTGIFQMGLINAAQTVNYTIYTHINGCNSDSIVVYHGWDCSGYPLDVDSYICTPLQTTLYITPLMPELSSRISAVEDTIGLCDTAHFEIEVRDFQLGNAFNLRTSINVPSGMIIEPGSCYLMYPEGGTYVSIPNPVNTSGNNWRWDISALEATINENGLQGVLDQTKNKYFITFNCLTDCDFVSGSRITCLSLGEAKCGRQFNSNVGVSNQIFIGDALPPYEANIRINTTYISPCLGNTPIELVVVNNGPLAFGVNDSIYFRLDNGINYDLNSFTPILNSPINGTPTITNNNGIDELAWKLPTGVGVGDTTKFSFTINGDPNDLECGVLQLASQITTYGGAVCSTTGSFCNIDIATADTLKNIFIYKGYLDVSNSLASYATLNAPTGETGHISFDIFNSGETISGGTETIIQYYHDTDNDGVYSIGDTYITNDTITDELTSNVNYDYSASIAIPSGLSCKLIAVIDTSLNPCTCVPSQILINLPLVLPSVSETICTTDTITVGNELVNNYGYSWSPATNLFTPTSAQSSFYANLAYPATNTYELVRTIDRLGCFATDTTNILVYSVPVSQAGPDQELCATYTTTLVGNQPQGTANGLWIFDPNYSQDAGAVITNPTLYNTTVTDLVEGTYQLIWVVSNGACAPALDTMQISIYNQPTADAGIDISICNDSVVVLNGNVPQGTASGEWIAATNFVQSSIVEFVDSSLYNTSATNLIEGSYQLVWSQSNGVCPEVSDVVSINVYNTPVATAGPDQELCNQYSTSLEGNIPQGLSTGVWSTDPNYVSPSVVNFTDATQNNTQISNLLEGTYQLIWTVSNGNCDPASDTVIIEVYDTPVSNAGADQYLCNVFTTNLEGNEPQGRSTGEWSIDSSHSQPSVVNFAAITSYNTGITGLQEGIYKFVWIVSNGNCSSVTDTVEVHVYNQPIADAGQDQNLCNLFEATLAGNEPQGTAVGVWIMDATHAQPSVVNFNDATNYNTTISDLQEGTYQLVWIVSNGTCIPDSDTMVINVYNQPTANAGLDQELCDVAMTTLAGNQPQGTATGLWIVDPTHAQPSSVTMADPTQFNTGISDLQEGTYQLIWTVSNGSCTPVSDVVVIKIYDQPIANAGLDQVICEQFTTVLEGNQPVGTATGLWTVGNGSGNPTQILFYDAIDYNATASNFQEGTYELTWTISNGVCPESSDVVELVNYKLPTANFNIGDRICYEECIDAVNMSFVQSPYVITGYQWVLDGVTQDQTSSFEPQFCFPDTGAYNISLIVETDRGCRDTSNVESTVTVMKLPLANFSYEPETEITELLEVQFTDLSIGAVSVHYDFGDGMETDSLNPIYWYTNYGDYEVTQIVVNEQGCVDTLTKPIIVKANDNLFIPNSFTPNGDGNNDVFYPVERGIESEDFDLFIFNRWGQLIYESHDSDQGWDGTHKNKDIKTGVYVWKLSYFSIEKQETIQKIGHVTVLY